MPASILRIHNTPRDYDWGAPGGIDRAFGRPAGDEPEAELWLGAHPSSPARFDDGAPWPDLHAWEQASGESLPFLLKLLAARWPLSLQAHPTTDQARAGFDREEAAGIPRDARERDYKDPYAKPELIVAVDDGFEALCGFRDVGATRELLAGATDVPGVTALLERLDGDEGLRGAVTWILEGGDGVAELVAGLADAATADPERWSLVALLAGRFPGDPGIALALLLNRVELARGECLFLPAGNIHAYLHGTGVELMGPSDNVLRGGLTGKHVDTAELLHVLDIVGGPPPVLAPEQVAPGAVAYRPASLPAGADIGFELLLITADAHVALAGPSIGLVVDGWFSLVGPDAAVELSAGDAVLLDGVADLDAFGAGRLFVATATAPTPVPTPAS